MTDTSLRYLDKQSAFSVAECPLADRQELVPDGDGFSLTAVVPNTLELRQWIRSLGPSAEVLEPGFLRTQIAEEIDALSRMDAPK